MTHPGVDQRILTTARLTLRPPEAQDAPAIVESINDFEVVRWLTHPPFPYGPADAEAFIAKTADGGVWMIHDADGLQGCVGCERELGYWLARRAWGRGYVTEAARAVLAWYFTDPDAAPLLSGFHIGNARSAHVLDKLGFTLAPDRQAVSRATGESVTIKGRVLDRASYLANK